LRACRLPIPEKNCTFNEKIVSHGEGEGIDGKTKETRVFLKKPGRK